VEEKSIHVTACTTLDGCCQFKKMPFGMVNSGVTFKRMRKLLVGLKRADNYVDDILELTVTWYEHLDMLRDIRKSETSTTDSATIPVSDWIPKHWLRWTSHRVRQVAVETEKLEQIRNSAQSRTKTVRSFLVLAGFYRRFIPYFAEVAVYL
jgi:hypothetical protein